MNNKPEATNRSDAPVQAPEAQTSNLSQDNGLGSVSREDLRTATPLSQSADILKSPDGSDLQITGIDDTSVVGRPKKPNSANPNVIVLDDFKDNPVPFVGGQGPQHGEFTARGLEAQGGFNVYRVQMSSGSTVDTLRGLEKKINSGELPVGKGDAITMSFGERFGDPEFKGLSQALGMDLRPENVAQQRGAILDRLKQLRDDPSMGAELNKLAGDFVESNEIIDRIEARGVDVVHASGNEGPNHFSIGFMNANIQLRSVDKSGNVHSFSANHNLTNATGDGVFGVRFDKKKNEFVATNSSVKPITFPRSDVGNKTPLNDFVAAHAAGTSFANISFLARYRPAMLAARNSEHDR